MTPSDLLDLGLKLFPITDDKRPAMKGWQVWAEKAGLQDLRSAWRSGYRAFGIYLRPTNLVVFDADDQGADTWSEDNLPRTPMRTLTKRGRHRFYRLPEGMAHPRDNKPVKDVKLDRKSKGYVVAPGSCIKGFTYQADGWWDTPLCELPLYPASMFPDREVKTQPKLPPIPLTDTGKQVADWFIENSDASVQGENGSKALKRAASFFVNDMALPTWQAIQMLRIWNERKASPMWSDNELEHAISTSDAEGPISGKTRGWAYSAWRYR